MAIVPATDLIRATVLSRFSSTGPISNSCDTSPTGALWTIPAMVSAAVFPIPANESFSFAAICAPRALASALMLAVVSLNIFGTTPIARTTAAGTAPRLDWTDDGRRLKAPSKPNSPAVIAPMALLDLSKLTTVRSPNVSKFERAFHTSMDNCSSGVFVVLTMVFPSVTNGCAIRMTMLLAEETIPPTAGVRTSGILIPVSLENVAAILVRTTFTSGPCTP